GQGSIGGGGNGNGSGEQPGARPGAPGEQVYIPGQAEGGPSDTGTNLPPGSQGAAAGLVPYDDVWAQYQTAALTAVDREVVSEEDRQLILQYFEGLNGRKPPRRARTPPRSDSPSARRGA